MLFGVKQLFPVSRPCYYNMPKANSLCIHEYW